MSGEDRSWMDNRWSPQGRITDEFRRGVKFFVEFARAHTEYLRDGMIRCPCVKCANKKVQTDGIIKMHLMKFGFVENYKRWTVHGETEIVGGTQNRPSLVTSFISEPEAMIAEEEQSVRMNHMVRDVADPSFDWTPNHAEPSGAYCYITLPCKPKWDNSNQTKGQYREDDRENSISEGLISPDDLDTRIRFQPDVWEATTITNSKSQGKRVKRRDKIYDSEGHGKQLIKVSSSGRSRSSLLCHPFSQTSSAPDPEKEQLREEVINLKGMIQQMQERLKKREQEQQEVQRQLQHFMQQKIGGQLQHQQRLNPSFMSYFPPGGMNIPQQQLQPFHQQLSPIRGTGGMHDLLLDSNFNFVGVGGSGGVDSRSGSDCDSRV